MKKLEAGDINKIAETVSGILGRLFENIDIERVNVRPAQDRDGDDILNIEVIFRGAMKGVADAKRVASAAREIRPALEELDTDLFPLLSFVSKLDYDRGHKSEAS